MILSIYCFDLIECNLRQISKQKEFSVLPLIEDITSEWRDKLNHGKPDFYFQFKTEQLFRVAIEKYFYLDL